MDILWIFIKTFRKNVLNPENGSCAEGKMDKHDPDMCKKGPPETADLGVCRKTTRHSEPVRTLAWESRR